MRFYLDTEFIERGYDKIELISIGLVAENGAEFYAVAADGWDESHASEWVKANVLPFLGDDARMSRAEIAAGILQFVKHQCQGEWSPTFYGWFSDYDWVLFCQLFGRMLDLPAGFPFLCRDVKQTHLEMGSPQLPPQPGKEHNALEDARHIKTIHEFLMAKRQEVR